jgi:hypothetical protein
MRMTADDLLIEARGVLPHHPGPAEALAAQAAGALLVDIRGDDQLTRPPNPIPPHQARSPRQARVRCRAPIYRG